MKRTNVLVLILCACFVSVARSQLPAAKDGSNWNEFLRPNMRRWNPYEKLLDVRNVGNLGLKWSFTTGYGVYSSPAVVNGVVKIVSHCRDQWKRMYTGCRVCKVKRRFRLK